MAAIPNATFASEDSGVLADFWANATGYKLQEAPPGLLVAIEAEGGDPNAAAGAVDPEGRGPRLYFRKMPTSSPARIPIHLDLEADDRVAEVERLHALGATEVETRTETMGQYTKT